MLFDLANPPTDLIDNVKWRREVRLLVESDPAKCEEVRAYCKNSLVYYVNGFGWTYKAKPFPGELVPMVLWPIQVRFMEWLQKYGGHNHLHLDKSRGMGASWGMLFFVDWLCRFFTRTKCLLASWKDDFVDVRDDPDTLFGKLDIINDNLPIPFRCPWDKKKFRRNKFALYPQTQSLNTGTTTTKKMGRAGRNAVVMLDEFAHMGDTPRDGFRILEAIRPTTESVIMVSTPFGMGNAFAAQKSICPLTMSLWWPDHPQEGAGLHVVDEDDNLEDLRPKSGFWSDAYEELRGKIQSPWHETEENEAVSPQYMAQEHEIDYAGSGWQFFPEPLIRQILADDCCPPYHTGSLIMDSDTGKCYGFNETPVGSLLLWMHLADDGWPTHHFDYCVGVDVAQGSQNSSGLGASNSCAVVINRSTGEVVAELTVAGVEAWDFAMMVLALCRFFHDAYLIWEGNGPGQNLIRIPRDFGYTRIFYRRAEGKLDANITREPGFWTTPPSKKYVFDKYLDALKKRYIIERCQRAAIELRLYQNAPNTVIHAVAESTPDPTGARESHADRVVARVMAFHGMTVDLSYNPQDVEPVSVDGTPVSAKGSIAFAREVSACATVQCSREHY